MSVSLTNTTWIMPAEWEKHECLWLAWPYDEITFPQRIEHALVGAQAAYIEIIKAIHPTEKINLLVLDDSVKQYVTGLLQAQSVDLSKIIFYIADYADVWVRDYGPVFVKNTETREKAWIKWHYNAYGNKFPDLLKDDTVFLALHDQIKAPMVEARIVMEGGSIEVNGKGTLITTEQCLLNPNRNPDLTREDIEDYLKRYTGAEKILWLKEGIVNDHTDGHIDDFVKFVNPTTLVCAYEEDKNDPNFAILDDAYQTLARSTDQDERPFTIIKLPMPHVLYDDGTKAPASYANFYIGNGVVLVPTFNDVHDAEALRIIGSLFLDRTVVGIDCSDIIYGGGAIHCITQQEPII